MAAEKASVKFLRLSSGVSSSYGILSGRNECMIAQNANPSAQLDRKSLMLTFCNQKIISGYGGVDCGGRG